MKEHEWIEDDILALIRDRAEESLTLEFKSCDSLRNKKWREELAKDVSAFANSAGGTIVYGIKENGFTHEAEQIDEGYDPKQLNKETLQRVIDSRIHRRIEGIRYDVVELTTTQPGKVLFVLNIPESKLAPHMSDYRFFKRFEYESKPMEKYEVRERYGREKFPGKDIVEAWRDDAINPLISTLKSEKDFLTNEQWGWRRQYQVFSGFTLLLDERTLSANKEDFISRYSDVGRLLQEHDLALVAVNEKGKKLYESFAKSPLIREVFARSTCDDSLLNLKNENKTWFQGSTSTQVFAELFGTNWDEQERLECFAEWAINSRAETNIAPMIAFWQTHGHRFRQCVVYSDFYPGVILARETLSRTIDSLLQLLKNIRRELSEGHNVSPEARQQSMNVYNDPFRL